MRRKLIKQGRSGTTIYLPKKWVDSRGLKPGDELNLTETAQGILLQAEARPERKEVTLDFDFKNRRFLEYTLTDYYRAGYDRLILPATIKEAYLRQPLSYLSGFEISEISDKRIVIEVLSEPAADKTELMLKHIFFILKDDIKNIIHSVTEKEVIDKAKIISDSERMVRYINLFMRSVSKKISEVNNFYWSLVNFMHLVGRQMIRMVDTLEGRKPIKVSDEDIAYIGSVLNALDLLYDGLYKKNFNSFQKIHDEHMKQSKILKKVYSRQDPYELIVMMHFRNMYRFILYMTGAAIGILALEEK